jgi:methionine synthase I (cobalamin-dependent)
MTDVLARILKLEQALSERILILDGAMGRELFALAEHAQRKGWNAEDLLRLESKKRERSLRQAEGRERKTAG